MNTFLNNLSKEEVLNEIERMIKHRVPGHVIALNIDQIVRIEYDTYFRRICNHASLLLMDSTPLRWIAKFYHISIKEKLSGSDFIFDLCEMAVQKGYSMFLLGAAPGVADIAAKKLQNKYKGLHIAGCYSPPMGFETDPQEIEKINQLLIASRADMLIVGMGVPKQDIFIYENMHKYQIPMSFSVGATIDFIAGVQKRAPKWMSKAGLEWAFRMCHHPQRLIKRYLKDDIAIFRIAHKYRNNSAAFISHP
jgi:N-acetylglucosaminyldiphosphoundecaprenol N-acetyl-beta-D-mannosaminyltransferase